MNGFCVDDEVVGERTFGGYRYDGSAGLRSEIGQPSIMRDENAPYGKPKLLDQYRQALRARHYNLKTEASYVMWVIKFIELRVQNIDFAKSEILIRNGKGAKDRITLLPESAKTALNEHLVGPGGLPEAWTANLKRESTTEKQSLFPMRATQNTTITKISYRNS